MYISEVMTGSAAVHQVLQPSNRNESHGRRRYALRAKKDRWTTWANCCSLSRGSVQRHNTDQAGVFSLGCEEFGYLERHYVRGVGFFTKLTSASWSSSCFGKLLGGLESPIAWNFIFNYPPPPRAGWFTSSLAVPHSPRGLRRHVAASSKFGSIRNLSIIVFSCQAPCQATVAFVPYPWASSLKQRHITQECKRMRDLG